MSAESYNSAKKIADSIIPLLPPEIGNVARFISVALGWAASLITQGIDPIKEIERIKAAGERVAEVEEEWKEEMEKR